MQTNPATAPEQAPRTVALPRKSHSAPAHAITPAAAAKWVETNAFTAPVPAESELPALNPNQPTQRSAVPMHV